VCPSRPAIIWLRPDPAMAASLGATKRCPPVGCTCPPKRFPLFKPPPCHHVGIPPRCFPPTLCSSHACSACEVFRAWAQPRGVEPVQSPLFHGFPHFPRCSPGLLKRLFCRRSGAPFRVRPAGVSEELPANPTAAMLCEMRQFRPCVCLTEIRRDRSSLRLVQPSVSGGPSDWPASSPPRCVLPSEEGVGLGWILLQRCATSKNR